MSDSSDPESAAAQQAQPRNEAHAGTAAGKGSAPSEGSFIEQVPDPTTAVPVPDPTIRLTGRLTYLVGLWLMVIAAGGVVGLLSLWPLAEHVQLVSRQAATATPPTEPSGLPKLNLLVSHPTLTADLSIILLGMLSGVLGSLVHALTRLTQSGKGNKSKRSTPRRHDALWFITSPVQGGLLAFFVIAAVSAGLLSTGQSSAGVGVNLFTVAIVGGVTGLFSKRMTAWLATIVNRMTAPATPAAQQAAQQAAQAGASAKAGAAAKTLDSPNGTVPVAGVAS